MLASDRKVKVRVSRRTKIRDIALFHKEGRRNAQYYQRFAVFTCNDLTYCKICRVPLKRKGMSQTPKKNRTELYIYLSV